MIYISKHLCFPHFEIIYWNVLTYDRVSVPQTLSVCMICYCIGNNIVIRTAQFVIVIVSTVVPIEDNHPKNATQNLEIYFSLLALEIDRCQSVYNCHQRLVLVGIEPFPSFPHNEIRPCSSRRLG